jgi:cell fate regulator YaaT (PSP1 superfamily)
VAELYQVERKGSRREFYYNTYYHTLKPDDYVIIQLEQGEDLGLLTKKIETRVDFSGSQRPRSILRPAGSDDLARFEKLKANEIQYQREVLGLVSKHSLEMKIIDVECQFDGSKITFYFTADHRVDFRALVRDLASRYRTRIELRQIGVRDEARRIDGYGICGQRQCCNGHITEFHPISTQHAREQELSLNPAKISGNCGRLLCCLRYEVDHYTEVRKSFPRVGTRVRTTKGIGTIDRIDIFKEKAMFFNEEEVLCSVGAEEILGTLEEADSRTRRPGRRREEISPSDEAELRALDDEQDDGQQSQS